MAIWFCRLSSATDFNIANGDVSALQGAIAVSGSNNVDDNIFLATSGVYTLTAANNGENGLPIVQSDNGHSLTIFGSSATISRSTAGGTPNFRILTVASGANLTLDRVTISHGHLLTGSGGGISNSGNLTLTTCVVFQNDISGGSESANASGGGISNTGVLNVINSAISFNSATAIQFARGAGISSTGSLTISGSTFRSNGVNSVGVGSGGGIYNRGPFILTNSTLSGNTARGPGAGAGLYHQPASGAATATLTNDTIVSNDAASTGEGGGVVDLASGGVGAISIRNTIIAKNTAGTGPDVSAGAGAINSLGHNLIGNTNGNSGWVASDLLGADPQVAAIQNNGGPTETHALMPGSPAIDAGDDSVLDPPLNLTTDQRGFPRRINTHVDIGAYELDQEQHAFVVNTIEDHDDGVCTLVDCSLREAINAINVFDPPLISFAPNVRGTIELTAELPDLALIDVEIIGPGANLLTIHRRVSTAFPIFRISGGVTTVKISGLTLSNGKGDPNGGCIVNVNSYLTLTRCVLTNNSASNGAGIHNDGTHFTSSVTLDSCTLRNNNAVSFGGAIFNSGVGNTNGQATVNLVNCTIADNSAGSRGAAIHNTGAAGNAAVALLNCTLSNNSAPLGGIFNTTSGSGGNATVTVRNSIFKTGSSGGNFTNSNANIVSQGHNLSNDAAGGDAGTAPGGLLNQPGDKRNTNPLLDTAGLKNNGGSTDTIALLMGSPAINAGDDAAAPPSDQRVYQRAGVSDIGAFEFGGTPIPVQMTSAVSRKVHGVAGNFDINLPLTGNPGIECRTGGASGVYKLIFSFANTLTSVGNATVTSGTGSVSSHMIGSDAHNYIVNLTGVSNAQVITVSLTNVNDSAGNQSSAVPISMGVLLGDTTGNRSVNASDVSQTKSKSGQIVNASNFRTDVTVSNSINSSDVSLVKSKSGTALP